MDYHRLIAVVCVASALGAGSFCVHAELQALDEIRGAAREFLVTEAGGAEHGVDVEVARLDARLRLQRCDRALTPFLPPGARLAGHTSVGVRCDGDVPWTLYVPALVRRPHEFVVTTRPIARGATLTAADVTTVTRLLPNPPAGVLESPEFAIGRVALRDLGAGVTLNAAQLKAPQTVRRGQAVTLALAHGPIAVRVAGTALKDGAIGERIPVRNVNSKRIVEGVVLADGVVQAVAVGSLP